MKSILLLMYRARLHKMVRLNLHYCGHAAKSNNSGLPISRESFKWKQDRKMEDNRNKISITRSSATHEWRWNLVNCCTRALSLQCNRTCRKRAMIAIQRNTHNTIFLVHQFIGLHIFIALPKFLLPRELFLYARVCEPTNSASPLP